MLGITSNCGNRSTFSVEWPTRGGESRSSTIDPLLTYYGDDFTGSTDVLEALHSGGIEAVLFVTPPSSETLQRYAHVRAFGIAGNSRTMSPEEMDQQLPNVFATLRAHEPRIVHYKVCSTFDSSPSVGSIGRAADIGDRVFGNRLLPTAVASPPLGRYCVFGNLFARSGLNTAPYRLDRHPTMLRHPITPMNEADLRVHLARQTSRQIELIDVMSLEGGDKAIREKLERIQGDGSVVLFDTLTTEHLETVGRTICEIQQRERKPQFVIGSSGVDYALVRHWQSIGLLSKVQGNASHSSADTLATVDRTIILSGSCSPVTDRQIAWALEQGFANVPVDARRLQELGQARGEIDGVVRQAVSALGRGHSVIVHTSRGPSDPRVISTAQSLGMPADEENTLGATLGTILREILDMCPVGRIAVVGGDTAGQVARSLDIEAVEMVSPLEPGAPLCIVRSPDSRVDGLEVTFKGGQVGYDEFFGSLLSGRCRRLLVGAN